MWLAPPLYALDQEGGFKNGGARSVAFTTTRLAAEMPNVSTGPVRNDIVAGKLKLNGCDQIPIEAVDRIRSADQTTSKFVAVYPNVTQARRTGWVARAKSLI